jgi:hypothetical protein
MTSVNLVTLSQAFSPVYRYVARQLPPPQHEYAQIVATVAESNPVVCREAEAALEVQRSYPPQDVPPNAPILGNDTLQADVNRRIQVARSNTSVPRELVYARSKAVSPGVLVLQRALRQRIYAEMRLRGVLDSQRDYEAMNVVYHARCNAYNVSWVG